MITFKYDYNTLSTDAFHTQVDKVELYVFGKDGSFLFKQTEEGAALATGNYSMRLDIPAGQYKLMAWAGARSSYTIKELTPGTSTITDMTLQLKRDPSLIINKEVEPLWYGEILDINYSGAVIQTETINLIKDTNKLRFVFQGFTSDWTVEMNDYSYQIIASNGLMDYKNELLKDDSLSYQPYYMEQKNPSGMVIEMNTMRLMADRSTRFVVTKKATGKKVFEMDVIELLRNTEIQGHGWGLQEYLDREDEYAVIFFFQTIKEDEWDAEEIRVE